MKPSQPAFSTGMKKTYHFLYLEDHPEDVELLTETLRREYIPCEVTWVNGRSAFESALTGGWSYDLIFADYALPDIRGEEALAAARRQCKEVPFIFISGAMGEETVVECLRSGATDYVLKTNLARLAPVVRRALDEARESTARREAEAAASRAVSLLRATLESTSEGILVVDLAGKISTYNRKFMALCGIPDYVMAPMEMERVLQFLLDQFQDPEALLAEARLLGSQRERESYAVFNTKGERVLEEQSRPHRIGEQTVGRVFSFRDVTAREKSAVQLRGLADRRQSLLEAAGAGRVAPWCLTEDSLLLSEFAATLLDLPPAQLPKDLAELEALIHPEDLDRFRQALEHPHHGSFEVRMRQGGGAWIWTRWNLERNPAAGYRGIFMDITEQRHREEAWADLRRAQGMAFLAENSAQVIRNLLQGAAAEARAVAQAGPLEPAQSQHLEAAQALLARMDGLLTQMRTAARCTPDTRGPLDVQAHLESLRLRAQTLLGPGIALSVDLVQPLPPLTMGGGHLDDLIINLLLNARDALQGAGGIRLRVAPAGSGITLEVVDAGPGIPLAVQSRMFDPFFSTRKHGHGLGLAVVRSIVEAYRGSLQVESAAGSGTTLRVTLPG